MRTIGFIALLAFLFSGKLKAEVCPTTDKESLLQQGHDYSYRFHSEALAEAVGTTKDRGKIRINCDVRISHASECYYKLQLKHCTLTAAGGTPDSETAWINEQTLPDLSRYSILFSLISGEVTEVRTHENDPVYFVNVKRGALSAFVFKMSYTTRKTEEMHTDIHGTCPLISMPVTNREGSVKTTKDMLHCSFPGRKDWELSPWSMFWNMSFIQYVINSTTDCEYSVNTDEKHINKVYCKERHAIMLESSSRTAVAVQSNIFYTMSYVDSKLQTRKPQYDDLTRNTDIQYEYEITPDASSNPHNFLTAAKKMLSDLVLDSRDEIRLHTIPQFTNFVSYIRSSSNLTPLVEAVESCSYLPQGNECTPELKDLGESYLKDALMQCNTIQCIETISHLAKEKEFSEMYLNFIYYSWSNMHFAKPAVFKHIMNMCRDTDSDLCWISTGTLVKRSYSKYEKFEREGLELLKAVAQHFHNSVDAMCSSVNFNLDIQQHLVRDLKAISNMGRTYLVLLPSGYQQMMECLKKTSDMPVHIRTSVFETLKNIEPCKDEESCDKIYEDLLPLMVDPTTETVLRVLAYDHIVHIPQKYNFEEKILNILKANETMQLKSFIASSLKSLFKDPHFNKKEKRFVVSMNELLDDNEISLDSIINEPEAKSVSNAHGISANLPFMPDELNGFGFKAETSTFSELSDVIPRYFHSDVMMQMFNKFMKVIEARGYSEGIESLVLVFQKFLKDINSKSISMEDIFNGLQEVLKEFGPDGSNSQTEYNFNEEIVKNIRNLEEIYRRNNPKSKPFFTVFLDLFGSTVSHFTSGNVASLAAKLSEMQNLLGALQHGINYNTTKVIRVIEAYHQVPTMMGLPLNWTTNATLAFSIRSGLKLNLNKEKFELHSEGYYEPSAALTFLNRMVLDFPTVTQIGVQANSSGYTSTQWKAHVEYSKEKKRFSLKKPTKTQKVLELFRTNQLIKHDTYEDIPDWDIERTSSIVCSDDTTRNILGLQFCIAKSYPMVTKRLKPWALMAGWCKWQLQINPSDEKIQSYDMEIVKFPGAKSKELLIRFSTPGSENSRELLFRADNDPMKGELSLDVTINTLPDFTASFVRKLLLDNDKLKGEKTIVTVQLQKNHEYQLLYNIQFRQEEHDENRIALNESPKEKKKVAFINERILTLVTPYNYYKLSDENYKSGENEKKDIVLSYENLNPKGKWLQTLLPQSVWEDDSKAWMKFQINWKAQTEHADSTTRQTVCFIQDPHTITELDAESLEMSGKEQIHINITKNEISTGKILAFANITYDLWKISNSDSTDKEIRLFNATISRKSWAAMLKTEIAGGKRLYEISLNTAAMIPRNSKSVAYVGWWDGRVERDFKLEENEIKLVIDLDSDIVDSEELVTRLSTLTAEDVDGLRNVLTKAKIYFYYPLFDEKESMKFDGYFISSRGPTTFRFQKNFVMESSYNNLELTSHSVYRIDADLSSLYHRSYFTHMPSGAQAFHVMEYKRSHKAGECMEIEFRHSIDSKVYDFESNASYKCNSNGENLHTLLLHQINNSTYWDMLNLEIHQLIEDVSPEYSYETTNFTHPLFLVNVTANWHGKSQMMKKVVFASTSDTRKNSELLIQTLDKRITSVKFSMAEDEDRSLFYERRISPDHKNLKVRISYSKDESDESKDLQLTGQILNKHHHIWSIKLNIDTYLEIKSLFKSGYESITQKIYSIAKNPEHPLNKMLEPALKVTLYQFWQGLQKQGNNFMFLAWKGLMETIERLSPFFDTPASVLMNLALRAEELSRKLYLTLKERSVIIWAISYFNLPGYFYESIHNFSSVITTMLQMLSPEDGVLRFEFVTGAILTLGSFKEWPDLSFESVNMPVFQPDAYEIQPHQQQSGKNAIIFGPLHVYTFDGHLYDSAEYSSDCTFVLAHDLRKSLFTVLSDKNAVHVLFPEMTVSVNEKNEVFINGSETSTALPVASYNNKIVVKRSNAIEIWSPSLKVVCSGKDFMCVLELDSWHNGKSFGLLGNSDGSQHNEFMLPEGKATNVSLEFIRSYEVSGKPECKSIGLQTKKIASTEAAKYCSNQFNKLCQLSQNIRESFIDACKSDYEEDQESCYAASGYSALCFYKSLPSGINCNGKRQESVKTGHKLEIVFIAHEHSSLTSPEKKNVPFKGIERLMTSVHDKFKANGYANILFSLVAFGGKGAHYHPSVHTNGRNEWFSHQSLVNDMLKNLEFDGDKDIEVLDAIRYAVEVLGYDTFHSKVFIILSAKDKQSKNKYTLDIIKRQLEKNGITLYTISSYPSIEKGKKVFGLRADGLIFPSPKKDGSAFMDYPKGDLAKLTSSTRGSIFLSKFILSNSPASFYSEFADEVWAKVRKEAEKCRQCNDVRGSWWWQVKQCNIVDC